MGKFEGFSSVKLVKPKRSQFDLSNFSRISCQLGKLVPILTLECVPSDTFHGSSEVLLRLAPTLAPVYDNIELYVHYYFVPNRILWNNGVDDCWETFITGGRLGVGIDPATAPVPPYMDIGAVMAADSDAFKQGQLSDYLGVPLLRVLDSTAANWNTKKMDIMPFLAYSLIWFEYYRDRNFIDDSVFTEPIPVAGGQMNTTHMLDYMHLRQRAFEHDYFTSALPFTQRGNEVLVPMEGAAAVTYLGNAIFTKSDGSALTAGATNFGGTNALRDSANQAAKVQNIDQVLFENTSVSINDFRSAYALQVWYERNAVGGSRYTESTQAHFGVKPKDSRLQRPEYIGGGRIRVTISEVVATAWANDGSNSVPQANMAGHGIAYGNTNQFSYFCTEHGFILGIASIMTPPSYHQGLPRMFFHRRTFLDYPWPTFAKLGEQPVSKAELYCIPANITPDSEGEFPIFGYQSRYADWKYVCNTNRGDFHNTLLFWTCTRHFSSNPTLGSAFVEYDHTATSDRIFAVDPAVGDTFDPLWLYVHNRVDVRRPLPYFSTPNNLGFQ